MVTSEFNMSLERFFSSRRSIEFNVGLIYKNEFLAGQIDDWTNADALFEEEGYAVRIHYKIFSRQEKVSKWKSYIAPGVSFKSLTYNGKPQFVGPKPDYLYNDSIMGTITKGQGTGNDTVIYDKSFTVYYDENYLQDRDRFQMGVQFLWGKVYEASRTLAFEFYFGAGITANMVTRRDYNRFATYHSKTYTYDRPSPEDDIVVEDDNQRRNQSIPNFTQESFYLRPNVQAGIKLRIRF